jgi:hypothetical protein
MKSAILYIALPAEVLNDFVRVEWEMNSTVIGDDAVENVRKNCVLIVESSRDSCAAAAEADVRAGTEKSARGARIYLPDKS